MSGLSVVIEIGDLRGDNFEEMDAAGGYGRYHDGDPRLRAQTARHSSYQARDVRVCGGQRVELDMAEARARVGGRETTTWVIFGEEGTAALLGAYTLEGVFLGVDPYGQRLIPVQGLLK